MNYKEWCIVNEHGHFLLDVSITGTNDYYMYTKNFEYRKRYFKEDELDVAEMHAEFASGTLKQINMEVVDYAKDNEVNG